MSDKKISQLTAANLPLAGTEVIPIVQSSTTDNITINNLAAGNLKSQGTTGVLQVSGPAAGATRVMTVPDANFVVARTDAAQTFTGLQTFDGAKVNYLLGGTSSGAPIGSVAHLVGGSTSPAAWLSAPFTSGYSVANISRTASTGDFIAFWNQAQNDTIGQITTADNSTVKYLTTKAGTGAILQSTGVNFAFQTPAAGMTSQLLNWYEEGTFTATVTPMTSGTVTLNSGYNTLSYTRIGRVVTVIGSVIVSSVNNPTGRFEINLPFASVSQSQTSGQTSSSTFVTGTVSANINSFVSEVITPYAALRVYLGGSTSEQSTSAQQLQAGSVIFVNITYFAA